jgi:hypothetical protein
VCLSNNPIWRIDPLGNSDTTVNGIYYPFNENLPEVFVNSKSAFSKKVMQRIREDAKLSLFGKLYVPGMETSKVVDLIKFTKRAEAQSLGEMLQLSRYQRTEYNLG